MTTDTGILALKRWHLLALAAAVAVPIMLVGYLYFMFQENAIREDIRHGVSTSPGIDADTGAREHASPKNVDAADDRDVALRLRFNAVVIGVLTISIYLLLLAALAVMYRSRQKNVFKELFEKEQELREYHKEFKTVLYSIGDGVISTDMNGCVKQMNHAAEELTGWTETESAGQRLEDVFTIINETTRKTVENPVSTVLKTGSIATLANHTLLVSKDGRETPIADSGAPVRNEEGTISGTVLVFRDKTEEHEAEQKIRASRELLQRSEARLNRGEDVAKIGHWELHMETGIMVASEGAKKIYGLQGDHWELPVVKIIALPEYRPMLDNALARLIRTGEAYNVDFKIRQGGTGEIIDVHSIAEYEGAQQILFGIVQDITRRKRLEQQLTQSQKLEGLGTLAGGIAHDFNNLLAMILGSAEMMNRQLPDSSPQKKYVDRIIEASERGMSISRQLLIFARPGLAEIQPISLTNTIHSVTELLGHFFPKSIQVDVVIDVENGLVMADEGQLHQALLNLAINAGDAMQNSGTLTIREYYVAADFIARRFLVETTDSFVAISVTDTGTGMDEATRLKIFDPFFSTKERGKGTGLGLAIVHTIVNNHRGYIDVMSTPGEGTTFTMFFPTIAIDTQYT